MKVLIAIVSAAGILASGAAIAQSGADLLKSKGCLGCHEMDKKKVGPGLKDVAAKYKGNKDAAPTLVAKLKEGKGHMKVNASDAELKTLVDTVLAGK